MKYLLTALYSVFVFTLLITGCKPEFAAQKRSFIVDNDSLGHWLLQKEVQEFTSELNDNQSLDSSTGLKKKHYLSVIERQVKVMQSYQDDQGRIIDPVEQKEMYYTTPCYAHSVSILASSGFTKDKALIESGMKALDNACIHLKNQFAPGNHSDFFTWPVMLAYRHFKAFADRERYQNWTESISGIKPEKFYAYHRNYSMNWNLVHAAGEFLRHTEGFTNINYIDTCMHQQLKHFTPYGMYNEWGNPLAYDLFSRHYIAGMLAIGYVGKESKNYRLLSQKGAWMSLFMQSPFGEQPTGFRSGHHIWNEAEQAMLFEIYAHQFKMEGQEKVASAFKRGAMLSLQSIKQWIRPDGSGYVVKNKYPIDKKHGYESYTAHSCYNMLATSMLAQAYEFSDDNINEGPAPCDMGSYLLDISKDFHKIIAVHDGTYMEYDTKGDQKYNPTGLLRVHIKGSHPQLGPSDGCAEKYSGKGISIATGPAWKKDEQWHSLASQKPFETTIKKHEANDDLFIFTVKNAIAMDRDTIITKETFTLSNGKVNVYNEIEGKVDSIRVSWPMLIDNGLYKSGITMQGNGIQLELENKQIKFEVDGQNSILRSRLNYNHRNGVVEPVYAVTKNKTISYTISKD